MKIAAVFFKTNHDNYSTKVLNLVKLECLVFGKDGVPSTAVKLLFF